MRYLPYIFIFFLALAFLTSAQAQVLPKTVTLSSSPRSPSPGQTVALTAATPLFDRNIAYFEWTINEATRDDLSGYGAHKVTLTAGDLGSTMQARVLVTRNGGNKGSDSVVIRVSELALTWFADTTTPKWFKGKALPVPNSKVEIAAFPEFIIDGQRIPASGLIYKWGLGDEKNMLSGVGKQTFSIQTSAHRNISHMVSVEVSDSDRRIIKKGVVFIPTRAPKLNIYPYSPLGGIEFRNGTGLFSTIKRGFLDFIAEPFFFPASQRDYQYAWTVEGAPVRSDAPQPNLITISTQEGPLRRISLRVTVSDGDTFTPSLTGLFSLLLQ